MTMLTRREILNQLKRVGVKELSRLKRNCRDFENYMAVNYDYEIDRKESQNLPSKERKK